MQKTGIADLARRSVSELSGGEQKLVALARAFAQRPEVLLLDEPSAHLNPRHAVMIFELLATEVRQKRLSCVAVAHDLNPAAAFADRVVLLHQGRVHGVGSVDEVMTPENLTAVFGRRAPRRDVERQSLLRAPPADGGSDPLILDLLETSIYKQGRSMRFLTLLLALVLLLTGCVSTEAPPQLLNVLDFAPREAEVGDRLEVIGAGFPEGKSARVLFKGTLYRPGHKAIKGVEIDVESASSSADKIEMMFTEGLQTSFCGSGDEAMHTTFKGDVIVSFPASTPGALPITGSARDVQIDFRSPSSRRAVVQARQDEGDRALKFMGLTVSDESPASGGLDDHRGSPCEPRRSRRHFGGRSHHRFRRRSRGLQVRRQPQRQLALRRHDVAARHRRIRRRIETDFGRRLSPQRTRRSARGRAHPARGSGDHHALHGPGGRHHHLGRASGLGAHAVAHRPQSRRPARVSRVDGRRHQVDHEGGHHPDRERSARSSGWRLTWCSWAFARRSCVMPFGQHLIAADLDIGILFVIAVTSLVTIGLMMGGWASNNKWSLLGGIRSAAQIISYEIPGAVAIVCIVMMTGSLRMQDIIGAQGGRAAVRRWPWDWFMFRNPITFALFFLYFTTALAEGNRAPFDLPEAESELVAGYSTEYSGMRYLFFFFAEWANVFVMCGIASRALPRRLADPRRHRRAQQEASFGAAVPRARCSSCSRAGSSSSSSSGSAGRCRACASIR